MELELTKVGRSNRSVYIFAYFHFYQMRVGGSLKLAIFYDKICTIIKPLNKTITTEGYINFKSDMLKLNLEVLIFESESPTFNHIHMVPVPTCYMYIQEGR